MAFTLPLAAIAFLLGICSTIWLTVIPSTVYAVSIALVCVAFLAINPKSILKFACIIGLGFAYMLFNINAHLAHVLNPELESKKLNVTGVITNVPQFDEQRTAKFILKITGVHDQTDPNLVLPVLTQINWPRAPVSLNPGQVWNLQVKLKQPRNFANPGSFDNEKFYFAQRISALGRVVAKTTPQLVSKTWYLAPVNYMRNTVLNFIRDNLSDFKFAGIITALVLGFKTLIPSTQWDILQNTGTAHLMSISGMHIGLIYGVMFILVRGLWKIVPARCMVIPAPFIAAWLGLFAAIGYALLAGFTVATQRALIMLGVLICGVLFKRKISAVHRYCLALLLVLLFDPFCVLSAGFWLSFLAVGSLMYAFSGRAYERNRIYAWLKPQLVITICLIPVSLLYFQQCSISGPIANLIAIPWVSVLIVPLCLLATCTLALSTNLAISIFSLADHLCAWLWPILEYFNRLPVYIWQMPDKYLYIKLICATLGAIWLLVPKGIPGRAWGILGFLPLFFVNTEIIPNGHAQFTLLDVGQGLSAVIRTQNHVLVYDTGAKTRSGFDFGSKVVAPYLQTQGVKKIDLLIISHIDNDHVGGAEGLLKKIPAQNVIINDDVLLHDHNRYHCLAGTSWVWDQVEFKILHPEPWYFSKKRNDQSCVLIVQAGEHKVLLTGDIENKAEKQLMSANATNLRADIMLVPHHGSKTSSSVEFINIVQPKFALVPVGYKNQYGHPKEMILDRYKSISSKILRTDFAGAISIRLGDEFTLDPVIYRNKQNRFWHAIN